IYDILPELDSAPRDIVAGMEIAVPLGGLIDFEKERERVTKELTRKENEARSLAARLDNISFMERAPREVVQEARDRHDELIAGMEKLRATPSSLGCKLLMELDSGIIYAFAADLLKEDLGRGDITTQGVVPGRARARARFLANQD